MKFISLLKIANGKYICRNCAIATHKADEFKQSPLKPVSAFRDSKNLNSIQGIKLFISIASLQEKQQQKKPPGEIVLLFMLFILLASF